MPQKESSILYLLIILGISFSSFAQTSQEDRNRTAPLENEAYKNPLGENQAEVELAPGTYVQSGERYASDANFKQLSLKSILEQGMRKNYQEQLRKMEGHTLDIEWQDARSAFLYPHIKLFLQTDEQKIGTIKGGSLNGSPVSKGASGIAGLSIGEYTLFNWGKDYLGYLNEKTTYNRKKELLRDNNRDLKHSLLLQYIELIKIKRILEVRKNEVRHTAFVYRLNREKARLGKIPQQDYLFSKNEYLRAQTEFKKAILDQEIADEAMSLLIGDEVGTRYIINEEFIYQRFLNDFSQLNDLALINNTLIKTKDTEVEISERKMRQIFREELPLPKITVNLGAYNYRFSDANNRFRYETTSAENSSVDLVATINATWTIMGPKGFLNARSRGLTLLQNQIAKKEREYTGHMVSSQLRNIFRTLKQNEIQEEILSAKEYTAKRSFDRSMDNYINRKTLFAHFKQSLEEMIDTQVKRIENQYEHLKNMISLANLAGIDEIPGKNFEDIVNKSRGQSETR